VRGGNGCSTAVQVVDLGIQLKLDHHQRGEDIDYSYLDLNPGDIIHGLIRTGDKVLSSNQEISGGSGKIEIHGPGKIKVVCERLAKIVENTVFAVLLTF
jgi:hypothetical protein